MKVFFLTGAFILFGYAAVFSQGAPLPVITLTNDTLDYRELPNSSWQILEDTGGKLTISDVRSSAFSKKFHTDSSRITGVDNSRHVYWFRMQLKNQMVKEAEILFYNEPYAERYDLYILRNGNSWQHLRNGVFIPYNKRDGIKELQAVPIVLKPGEAVTLYKRIYRATIPYSYKQHLSFGFAFMEKELKAIYVDNNLLYLGIILHSFAFGILLLACTFNVFYYAVNREKVYLFFALFLLFEGIVFMGDLFWFFFKNYPQTRAYINPLLRFFAIFFLVHFVRQLLQTFRYFPRWDVLLFILSYIPGFGTILALFLEPSLSGKWSGTVWLATTVSSALLLVAVLFTLIFLKKERNRLIRLMLIAVLPALCLWTIEFSFLYIYSGIASRYRAIDELPFTTWLNGIGPFLDVIETICLSWIAIVFSWLLFMRYAQLRKEKEQERMALIAQQKIDLEMQVAERTSELKHSLTELKSTQAQLIQSEKMASLGELTAGIAHEIQNPLNFVNNFSEVNTELLDELEEEAVEGNMDGIKSIVKELKENEQKIAIHGKRADAIVKNMLQHSHKNAGEKQPTDINALADEYLRLSYHGFRAKDKSFNTRFKTDFDTSIGKLNIVPQDMGRVLLNLFNNAFYAMHEQLKKLDNGYQPTITIRTKRLQEHVEIQVQDNGMGISKSLQAKIFQPFFTTKPTGQGTGLGLSLSYDIIKAHGGEIQVESREQEGTKFTIWLPVA